MASLASHAWTALLHALSTSTFGVLNSVLLLLLGIAFDHWFGGAQARRVGGGVNIAPVIRRGAVALGAIAVVFVADYLYFLVVRTPQSVYRSAAKHAAPAPPSAPGAPGWALEIPPRLSVQLRALNGFNFVMRLPPGAAYSFANRREYRLLVKNEGGMAAQSLSVRFQPPAFVLAAAISESSGAPFARVDWRMPMTARGFVISSNGCPASFAATVKVPDLFAGGRLVVQILLQGSGGTPRHLRFLSPPSLPRSYVSAAFSYRDHWGRELRSETWHLARGPSVGALRLAGRYPGHHGKWMGMLFVPVPCFRSAWLK